MKRQSDIVQRCRSMALDHYIFYCTLTYNNESLPSLTTSSGFDLKYADISDVQKMIKRLRFNNSFGREFSYFFVSERGSKRSRPHFHGLFFIPKFKDDDPLYPALVEPKFFRLVLSEWKRNYGSDRCPDWRPLCTFKQKYVCGKRFSNYDFHYVVSHSTEQGSDDVAFYVSKYMLKPSYKEQRLQQALRLNLDSDEYEVVWNTVKSRCFFSKKFGAKTDLQVSHVKNSIKLSSRDFDGLKYFASNGVSSPLAKYYRKYVGLEESFSSVQARGGPLALRFRDPSDLDRSIERGERIKRLADKRDISNLFPDY